MAHKKKALVFIEYDMIIRHFIQSHAFAELEKEYDVKYVFHEERGNEKRNIFIDLESLNLGNYIRFHVPRKRMGTWDHLFVPKTLNVQRGTDNYKDSLALSYIIRSKKWVDRYKVLALPGIFQIFQAIFRLFMGVYTPLEELLRQEQPDIVIHPTILQGYFINELVPICKKQGIPFICLMNSWDNPSQKAATTGFPDKLVVWGEQTRRHAIEYMKMPAQNILEFGAAQFQIYRKPVTETNAELRDLFKVPKDIPIILYAGISKGVLENNQLDILDKAIESGEIPPCHVIYRPHPWRGPLRPNERSFLDYNFKHITLDPFMGAFYQRVIDGSQMGFDPADYDVTRKLLHLVDGVTSPLSTILLEAIIKLKPVQILLDSDTDSEQSKQIMALASTITHFADLKGPGVNYCTDQSKMPQGINALLEQAKDPEIKKSLKELSQYFTVTDGPSYAERLLSLADELTATSY